MAEFLAIAAAAASITQLTGQILTSLTDIFAFWKKLQGAPEQVSNLLEDISGLVQMINNAPYNEDQFVKECCLKVELEEGKEPAAADLGKTQGCREEGRVKELVDRLERAKTQLMVANTFHQTSIQQGTRQEITMLRMMLCSGTQMEISQGNAVSAIQHNIEIPPNAYTSNQTDETDRTNNLMVHGSRASTAVVKQERLSAEMKMKTYWCVIGRIQETRTRYPILDDQAYRSPKEVEIEQKFLPNKFAARLRLRGFCKKSTRGFGRWTYSFTPIRVVPSGAPIIKAVVLGDLETIISLFERRSASIFDMSEHGWTLLHIAAAHFRKDLCRWLISHGLKGDMIDINRGGTPLHIAARHSGISSDYYLDSESFMQPLYGMCPDDEDVHGTIRALVEEGDYDPTLESPENVNYESAEFKTPLDLFTGNAETFRYLLLQDRFMVDLDSSHYQMRSLIHRNISHAYPNGPALARQCLSMGDGLSYFATLVDPNDGWTMLHSIAKNIIQNQFRANGMKWPSVKESFRLLLGDALRAGADIHAIDSERNTPLAMLAGRLSRDREELQQSFRERILFWLDSLLAVGHDLQRYVEKECDIYHDIPLWGVRDRQKGSFGRFHVREYERKLSLERGATTDDFVVHFQETMLPWSIDTTLQLCHPSSSSNICSEMCKSKRIIREVSVFIDQRQNGVQEFGIWPRDNTTSNV
ncbi:hypothetical protein EG329_006881 [Mollisiaceae sp. DMI_Dod_QoI]|nr:hypothetical protein EG329_006881 [Helotiales sp. DMI_Dod_QoI]